MRTLADFKKAMQLGTSWHAYNHLSKCDMGVRVVSKAQSNRFAFRTTRNTDSWCEFPKANDIEFVDVNTVNIYERNAETKNLMLTYTKQANI